MVISWLIADVAVKWWWMIWLVMIGHGFNDGSSMANDQVMDKHGSDDGGIVIN